MAQKNIFNYDGLYGDSETRFSAEYIFLELIATRSQTFNWTIQPHIHTKLFQLFFLEKGEVVFQETAISRKCSAPCIFFVPPAMLHGLAYSPDANGYILTISDAIIEDIFQTSSAIWRTSEKIQIIKAFDDITFPEILVLLKHLETELFSEQVERMTIIKAYIAQLFVVLHRLAKQGAEKINDGLTMNYFRKFQKSIKESQKPKSIPEFAAELNITAVHLNRICRTVSGKSAMELVHQHLIGEAQKYLLHTSYSISEITYILKFEYPNYFARLFKKHTGMSPVEFRAEKRK